MPIGKGEVRTYAGTPPASAFASASGTPIVIDTTANQPYYLKSGSPTAFAGGGGGGAPTGATYVVMALDGTLTAERVLTAGTALSLTDGGANGNATLAHVNVGSAGTYVQVTTNAQGHVSAGQTYIIPSQIYNVVGGSQYGWYNTAGATDPNIGIGITRTGTAWTGSPAGAGGNIAIGNRAGRDLTTGSRNIFIGHGAAKTQTTQANNIALGFDVNMGTMGNSVYIGNDAVGMSLASGLSNVFIQGYAPSATACDESFLSGNNACFSATSLSSTFALGANVFSTVPVLVNAVGIGASAGGNITGNVTDGIAIGSFSGGNMAAASQQWVCIGSNSGFIGGAANYFVLIGGFAGSADIAAQGMVAIGYAAGQKTSPHSVILGEGATTVSPAPDEMLYINADAGLVGTDTPLLGGRFTTRNLAINGNVCDPLAKTWANGTGVIFIGNRTAAPTINPVGGGILFADAGALKWRGSSGTVTTIAPA